jgi:uncharacterized protein
VKSDFHTATNPEGAVSLRITVAQTAKRCHCSLYEVIVEKARKRGLAGATVLRGVMGLDSTGEIHSGKILPIGENLPVVIEIVDTAGQIESFLPFLGDLGQDVTVSTRPVQSIRFMRGRVAASSTRTQPKDE